MVSVEDLRKDSKNREHIYKELYKKYLNMLYQKITDLNKKRIYSLYYNVPLVSVGYPLYDKNKCLRYIMKKLLLNNFNVNTVPTEPYIIHITW